MNNRSMSTPQSSSRIVVAGLSGDSGKTVLSLSLLLLFGERGISTAAFKKGPDYIDAAWLAWAAGRPARNLDTFLMGNDTVKRLFAHHCLKNGLNIIEGNRGLFDGVDAQGTHSTAELAKLLGAPVLLVVNATKVTHTMAALVLGCQRLDPAVQIRGVILNRVAGERHERVLRDSVENICNIPVLGVLPKSEKAALVPARHLGLVTPQEHPKTEELRASLLSLGRDRLDLDRILEIATSASSLAFPVAEVGENSDGAGLRIGYCKDSAFTFYYPDNLEALERTGAQLIPVSTLSASALPENLHALYIGGGFPETHGAVLSANQGFLTSLRRSALAGLPIYAECGGLMMLSRAIHWQGQKFPMAGVFPFEVEVCGKPQGHGYAELLVDHPNPFYSVGTKIRGHEFHYSRIIPCADLPSMSCAVQRGTGCLEGRDGATHENVWASYTHVHAAATPEWSRGLISAARRYSDQQRRV